jgi:sialic acid synthase SpsE/protoporphyrinogen oxidase
MKKTALILGAGPAGLVCGWRLAKNGWNVEIYEKQPIVGGMCRTWKWHDFLVDTGPHIFHTPDSDLIKLWENEFSDLFLKGEYWCKNVKGKNFDEYWDYPLSWESISKYPSTLKTKIITELDERNLDDKARAKSFKDYVSAEVGPTLCEMFFNKYPKKIWGISTDKMTPDWAPKRIEFRNKISSFWDKQWNAVGKFGTGCIYEKIADKIRSLEGNIHLNSSVTNINYDSNRINNFTINNDKIIPISKDNIIISTLPINMLSHFLGKKINLEFRGICSVFLAYNKEYILPENLHWLYYDSEDVIFNRVTESKRLSKFTCPDDKTYLTAEITYTKGDNIDTMNEKELMSLVSDQVSMVNLADKKILFDISLNKEPYVYPLQFVGYQEELAKCKSHVSKFEQLYTLGTGGDYNYSDSQVIFHKAFDTVSVICDEDSNSTQVLRKSPSQKFNSTIDINNRLVGNSNRTYIIAEAGLNHNGSMKLAKELIVQAKLAGCDAVKFQSFKASNRVSKKVKSVKYAETILGQEETIFEMFDRLALNTSDQEKLFEFARSKNIELFSTPFDIDSANFLESMNVQVYKIASMDLVNLELIEHVALKGKPIIISTGMSSIAQVDEAVQTVMDTGNNNLMLLHCNSSYPADPEEMNLNVIKTLKSAFSVPVGLSDHTFGLSVSNIAMVLGANLIERHFTLDRTLDGPDHILSSEPAEMRQLVDDTHSLPKMLGDGVKRIQPSEYNTINTQRKSIYTAKDIKKGTIITKEMITVKGPGGGLLPKYTKILIGKTATKDIESDCPITWDIL